ncbi:MAG: TlpA disulfide reductase family protein [Candidatus Altiarchaeota archaeon]
MVESMRCWRGRISVCIIILSVLLASGCTKSNPKGVSDANIASSNDTLNLTSNGTVNGLNLTGWRETQLEDVLTGDAFRVSDFEGQPVLVESFAVWCPTCKQQQDQMNSLLKLVVGEVVVISLDTDPSEDAGQIKQHIEKNGYTWLFAVPPPEMTRELIKEFGVSVVNAPAAPVILVCENQSARLLGRGIKSDETLLDEISRGC